MGDGLLNGGLRLLVRHLQEQQKRQLLDVVAVGQAVIPQDVAVVPELLDELAGDCHDFFFLVARRGQFLQLLHRLLEIRVHATRGWASTKLRY